MVPVSKRNVWLPVRAFAVVLLLLAGCSGEADSGSAEDTAVVRVRIGSGANQQRQDDNVPAQILLRVTTGEEQRRDIQRSPFSECDPPATVVIPITIPANVEHLFAIEVLNRNGMVLLRGESTLKLPPGKAAEDLRIVLAPVNPPERPSIDSDETCAPETLPLAVTQGDAPDPVALGQTLTYTLEVTNFAREQRATDITLTDDLPVGVTFVEATSSQGSCAETDGTVACSLGDVAPGDSATVTIRVTPTVPGTITNTATVTAPGFTTITVAEDTTIAPPPVVPVPEFDGTVTVNEGDPHAQAIITVTLSEASTRPITVDFTTADQTAKAGLDYEETRGTLRFPQGTTQQQISVPILDDTAVEPNETFVVMFSNPTNTRLDEDQGVVTIIDDESAVFAIGTGLANPSGPATTGMMTLLIPDSSPFRAFLTWQQRDQADDGVDATVTFNNGQGDVDITGQLASDFDSRCFLAEITDLIEPGPHTYTVSGVNNEDNPGAGIVVISAVLDPSAVLTSAPDETLDTVIKLSVGSEPQSTRSVEVKAGCDFFFHGIATDANSRVITFDVAPMSFERQARVILFVGDAQSSNSPRGNDILFFTGTGTPPVSLLDTMGNPIDEAMSLGRDATGLVANDGDFWDTFGRNSGVLPSDPGPLPTNDPDLRGGLTIPVGATFVSFQLISPAGRQGVSAIVSLAVLEIVGPSGAEALTP